ncbi:mechanosensitive ion channel family protein [Curvibacter sp. HBC61]|uniref:Small-conductance mechanosensitive channel n=1 Tax=Curvibacter cyanobacteriorum TaxID=3026422 RepID=A0ABT5MW88_9BURK|nr:mechanosensitive ion channel family protein [Curvibacter sp. HBC61]MDD0837594.1 mechanosensitive ion channel family protein [Curvibacter sp. HBC61]
MDFSRHSADFKAWWGPSVRRHLMALGLLIAGSISPLALHAGDLALAPPPAPLSPSLSPPPSAAAPAALPAASSPLPALAATAAASAAAPAPGPAELSTLSLNQRRIVTFRASLLGDSPADRTELAREALNQALAAGGPGRVTHSLLDGAVRLEVDGQAVFFLLPSDLGGPRPASLLAPAAREVSRRLQTAIDEHREATDPRSLARGALYSALATGLAFALLRLLLALRRRLTLRLQKALKKGSGQGALGLVMQDYMAHARTATHWLAGALTGLALLLLLDAWATFVVRQFAYTRPWGERSTAWLMDLGQQLLNAVAQAVPSLVVAVLIFWLARLGTRLLSGFLARVERDEVHLPWLDADSAMPTRRLGNLVIWLFALAMAYPYLPGANSEAFKGVTVLAGLMLSLGASSVVGQALSGLTLLYSRSLRVGEYVKMGDTEGTVVALGLFTTKVHTGMGEEVSVPNTVVFNQPIRNFSRLVADGQFVMHTAVTIGYATPWRQVHAMLLEAARRTPGVATEPAPYVVQTALSDFYVEYRLCAQSNKQAPHRRAEAMSQLHTHIQDVFNEMGVQIMSPHYLADPPEAQVVPPGPWASPPGGAVPQPPEAPHPPQTRTKPQDPA